MRCVFAVRVCGTVELQRAHEYQWASTKKRVEFNKRWFFLITDVEVKHALEHNTRSVKAVPGTQKFHSVRAHLTKVNTIEVRNRGCCCEVCMEVTTGVCSWQAYTDPWREVELVSATDVDRALVVDMHEQQRHSVAEALEVKDVFALAAADDEEDFILIQVDTPARKCTEDENGATDFLGQQVFTNEWFITGHFLEYTDQSGTAYLVDPDPERVVFVATQRVRAGPLNLGINEEGHLFIHPEDIDDLLDAVA